MSAPEADSPTPERRRRLRSVVWAAIGCSLLAILGLGSLGACGYVVARLVDRLGS